jgi:hypothetical protein
MSEPEAYQPGLLRRGDARDRVARLYLRSRAARAAAQERRFQVLRHADHFRPMASAFRAERRRGLIAVPMVGAVVNHKVICSQLVGQLVKGRNFLSFQSLTGIFRTRGIDAPLF